MAFNIHNRNLLSLEHHTTRELRYLLDLSRDLKRAKYTGTEQQHLKGNNIALIFEKTSTRTRCAFEWRPMTKAPTSPTSTPTLRRLATKRA